MELKTENHNGACSHCLTDAPVQAKVCTGCGARWGFSNGMDRQQLYDANISLYKLGRRITLAPLVLFPLGFLLPEGPVQGVLLLTAGLSTVTALFGANLWIERKLQIKTAESGEIKWWR